MPRGAVVVTAVDARPGPRSARLSEKTVLLVAAFGAFLAFLDVTVVNVAFPSIRASFPGTSIGDLSWVLNSYNIVLAAAMVVFGRLADLVGRKRLYLLGIVVFVLASALCAVSGSVAFLVIVRCLQALGAAMLIPASLALVVEAFPSRKRAHAVGLWGASAAVAAGLGPPIGGALVELGSWRWAFLVNVPVGALAVVAARRGLVESRRPGRRRLPDIRGSVLLAVALGALTTGIVTGNDWGWASWRVLTCFAVAALGAAGFVISSRIHPSPLVDPALLRVRGFVVANLASTIGGMGFFAYMLTNVLWLQYIWHYSVLRSGFALVPSALVAAVVAGRLGPLAQTRGYRLVVIPGALVWAAAYLWYASRVGTDPAFVAQWLPGQVLSGIGVGATLPILGSASLASVPGGGYATASAVNASVRQLGGVLGIALLVVVIGTPTPATAASGFRAGWIFSAACFLVCAVAAAALGTVREGEAGAAPLGDDGTATAHLTAAGSADLEGPTPVRAPLPTLLEQLSPPARAAIEAEAQRVDLPAGQVLFDHGDDADAAYAVVSGRLEVVLETGVRLLGPGAVLGELALLTQGTRSALVRAKRDSVLLRLRPGALRAVMAEQAEVGGAMARVLARQLSQPAPPARAGGVRTIAVVGLHPGAPVVAVTEALATSLARHLRVVRLDDVDSDGLARAEREFDRVLLVAPDPRSPWWSRAVRQADAHVLVAAADLAAPGDAPMPPGGGDVVLVGPDPGEAARVAWVHAVDAWQLTRVDDVSPSALRSLADRLAGRSLGLVLAGGGARALSHLGVLMALEEADVPVDRVAGCSLGAIVAAFHCLGLDAAATREAMYDEFVRHHPFADYTLPRYALAKGARARAAARRNFAGRSIEGLPRQFRCVSTDLLAREVVIHRRGSLGESLLASFALPGLFPPVRLDGRLLVDGGVLANLPYEALLERDEGPVVAVNVGMGGTERRPATPGAPARPPRTPLLGETLLRTMLIGSGGAVSAAVAAGVTVVTPPSLGVGLLEFHQFDVLVEAGLIAGRRLLDEGAIPS